MNKFSNIVKIPAFTDLYKEMVNKIAQKLKASIPGSEAPVFNTERKLEDVMMVDSPNNFIISTLNEDSQYKVLNIRDISDKDSKFLLHLNVMAIYPQSSDDFVSVLCQKCQMSSLSKEINDLSNDSKFTCKFCKTKQAGKLYYNVQFVCRENNYSNKLIVLHLSTFDDQGHGFFPITPLELVKNSNQTKKINEVLQKIQEMDTYISVLVEAIKTGTNEGENIYRIIGDYQNTLA